MVLAGDITLLRVKENYLWFFKKLSKQFKAVYWLPGNHEYYHSDLANFETPLFENILKNVFLLKNKTIIIENVELIFSILWSYIPVQHEWITQKNVSDFHYIKLNGKTIMPKDFNVMHEADLEFIKEEIAKPTGNKKIVVTHHVPTLMHYPTQYLNSEINGAFATELFDVIESSNVNYWIYGHHHCNTADFNVGKTTMLTNQLGYVHHQENILFRNDKFFEI